MLEPNPAINRWSCVLVILLSLAALVITVLAHCYSLDSTLVYQGF